VTTSPIGPAAVAPAAGSGEQAAATAPRWEVNHLYMHAGTGASAAQTAV
jgi:hypothetical protein